MYPVDATMARRKLLYIAHRIPYPPDKGDKIRSFHQVRHLGERHDLWCAFFVDNLCDMPHVDALRPWCRELRAIPISRRWSTLRGAVSLTAGGTITEGYLKRRAMEHVVREWCHTVTFDAALLFSSGMAPYRRHIRAGRVVLDFCDWDSRKWQSYADRAAGLRSYLYALEANRLRRRERLWLDEFDACTIITAAEAQSADLPPSSPSPVVIGNGATLGRPPRTPSDQIERCIGFVGQMDYPPNVDAVRWFADHVWPRVRPQVPDATFEIVGRAPTRAVRALARRDGITVTGPVDDVRHRIESHAVSVAPLRIGQGLQNKVLEAMAAARPVVLTSTAAAGIDALDRQHFVIADDPATMADQIVMLLRDPARRLELGSAARRRIAFRYSWPREMAKLESVLLGTSDGSSPPRTPGRHLLGRHVTPQPDAAVSRFSLQRDEPL